MSEPAPTHTELYALFRPFCTKRELRKVCAALATMFELRGRALGEPEDYEAAAWWLAKRESLDPPPRRQHAKMEADHVG